MKKGFTLIELLAVILILGIIALIAIPQIGNIVSDAKDGSIKRSVENYIKAVEEYVTMQTMKGNIISGTKEISELNIGFKGALPLSGRVIINNNEVTEYSLEYDDYVINSSNGNIIVEKKDKLSIELVLDINSNGNMDTGDKICIGVECFYVISNNNSTIRALSEWNLNVGYDYNSVNNNTLSYNATRKVNMKGVSNYTKLNPSIIKQDSTKRGFVNEGDYWRGVINFGVSDVSDNKGYWAPETILLSSYGTSYPVYVYDENSILYDYVNEYISNLNNMINGNLIGDLIRYEELVSFGCVEVDKTCLAAPTWLYNTTYWSGSAKDYHRIYRVNSSGALHYNAYIDLYSPGLRPVIEFNIN